jgi:Spy/CpxP family protein refolding chaperone
MAPRAHGGDARGPRDDDRGKMGGREEMMGPDRGHIMMDPWWKNPEVAARIGLTPEQTKRIDDLFLQSKVELIHEHAALEEAELMLRPLMDANPVDQAKATAQIDKIADTRAELEKTNAKMLLSIRAVLSADQWTKLQERPRGPKGHITSDHGGMAPPSAE